MPTDNQMDRFARATAEADRIIHQISGEQWDLPTPCTEWNLKVLVNHLVYENVWAPPLLQGQTIAEVGDRFEGDLVGDDPIGVWTSARRAMLETGNATAMDTSVDLSAGPTPAGDYVDQLTQDHVIHAWDVAKSIGADYRMDDDLVQWTYDIFAPIEDQLKASGAFGSKVEVAPDADLLTKLLAVTGRRADWSA